MLSSVLVASFSQILLKKSAGKSHGSFLKEYFNLYVIFGYGMMVGSTILTILAYREIEYKNGPIIDSLGFLFVMILSFLFFREPLTKKKILGNLLILFGIAVFYL